MLYRKLTLQKLWPKNCEKLTEITVFPVFPDSFLNFSKRKHPTAMNFIFLESPRRDLTKCVSYYIPKIQTATFMAQKLQKIAENDHFPGFSVLFPTFSPHMYSKTPLK